MPKHLSNNQACFCYHYCFCNRLHSANYTGSQFQCLLQLCSTHCRTVTYVSLDDYPGTPPGTSTSAYCDELNCSNTTVCMLDVNSTPWCACTELSQDGDNCTHQHHIQSRRHKNTHRSFLSSHKFFMSSMEAFGRNLPDHDFMCFISLCIALFAWGGNYNAKVIT